MPKKVSCAIKRHGWFSIELAICMVVFLILMAVFLPKSIEFLNQGRTSKAQSDLSALGVAISQYAFEIGEYPSKIEDLKEKKGQYGPWLKEINKDPWGNEYQYKSDKDKGFVVYSYGSDKTDNGTSVESVNTKDIGYVGK